MPKASMTTRGFFDPNTWTISYIVWDRATRRAAIIDPVLDYDVKSGHTAIVCAGAELTQCAGNR